MPTLTTIHDTGTIRSSRSTNVDQTRIHGRGLLRYRVRLHFDGYPDQSYVSAELWTPTGWTHVIRWTGREFDIAAASKSDEAVGRALAAALDVAEQVAEPYDG